MVKVKKVLENVKESLRDLFVFVICLTFLRQYGEFAFFIKVLTSPLFLGALLYKWIFIVCCAALGIKAAVDGTIFLGSAVRKHFLKMTQKRKYKKQLQQKEALENKLYNIVVEVPYVEVRDKKTPYTNSLSESSYTRETKMEELLREKEKLIHIKEPEVEKKKIHNFKKKETPL